MFLIPSIHYDPSVSVTGKEKGRVFEKSVASNPHTGEAEAGDCDKIKFRLTYRVRLSKNPKQTNKNVRYLWKCTYSLTWIVWTHVHVDNVVQKPLISYGTHATCTPHYSSPRGQDPGSPSGRAQHPPTLQRKSGLPMRKLRIFVFWIHSL